MAHLSCQLGLSNQREHRCYWPKHEPDLCYMLLETAAVLQAGAGFSDHPARLLKVPQRAHTPVLRSHLCPGL